MNRMSRTALLATALLAFDISAALAVPTRDDAAATSTQPAKDTEAEAVEQEIAAFRSSAIRLPDVLDIARRIAADALVADVSFDGTQGQQIYRLRTVKGDRLEEVLIDAMTGQPRGKPQLVDVADHDRDSLNSLQSSGPKMADAIRVAERAAGGQAVSGGIAKQGDRLNFIVVVLSGEDLKQVVLEAPDKSRAERR
jgi:uncharacterized membrane protein YkoI